MTDHAFNDAQARWDAAEPDDYMPAIPDSAGATLERLLTMIDRADEEVAIEGISMMGYRQATAAIWIDGHEYSLTLNREDG